MHEGSQKADFIVTAPTLRDTLCVDVSPTHPCAKSVVADSAATPGYAATCREREKNEKHAAAAHEMGMIFAPWVFETFGRWGSQVSADLAKLEMFVSSPLAFRAALRRAIAIGVQRGNAAMLVHAVRGTFHGPARPSCKLAPAARQLMRDNAPRTDLGAEPPRYAAPVLSCPPLPPACPAALPSS